MQRHYCNVENIAIQTNLCHKDLSKQSNKQLPTFEDTMTQDCLAFLAMAILMGIAKLPAWGLLVERNWLYAMV